ncbi:MAG: glycosyltransferase [Verrucomicrobiota bacterium]
MSASTQPRILHVVSGLLGFGCEGVLFRVLRGSAKDYRHAVVSLAGEGPIADDIRALGIQVRTLNMANNGSGLLRLSGLIQVLREVRPDIVQGWMYHANVLGGLCARFAGCDPVVWGLRNGAGDLTRMRRMTRFTIRVGAYLSRVVPRVILSCSRRACENHERLGYDGRKMVVIPNGYDLEHFHPDAVKREGWRRQLQVGLDVPLVGLVARWDPIKDHETFLMAARRAKEAIPRMSFLLAGKDIVPQNQALMAVLDKTGMRDKVILVGEARDVAGLMNCLDLLVLASRSEAFPNVLAEAMACGVPCASTDVGDAAHIVGDSGWIVRPGAERELSGAILAAMKEPETEKVARRRRARTRIESEFSLGRMVEAYQLVWNSLVAAPNSRGQSLLPRSWYFREKRPPCDQLSS